MGFVRSFICFITAYAAVISTAHAQTPAPKDEIKVTAYGFAVLNSWWSSRTFAVKDYPGQVLRNDRQAGESFLASARNSRIGIRVAISDENWTGAALSAVVEADFHGGFFAQTSTGYYNPIPRLRLATGTATWKLRTGTLALLAGQDYRLVGPVNPVTIGWLIPPLFTQAGNYWRRTPQLRLAYNRGAVTASAAALSPADGTPGTPAMPGGAIPSTVDDGAGNRSGRPDLEARLAVALGGADLGGTFGLAGHYNQRRYPSGTVASAVVAADLDLNLPHLGLRGEAYVGRAVDDTFYGPLADASPQNTAVKSAGFWVQAVLKPLEAVWFTAGYGLATLDPDSLTAAGLTSAIQHNIQIVGGVLFNAGKHWRFGLEGLETRTTYHDGERQVAVQFALTSQILF
jgi:hypothetical protein